MSRGPGKVFENNFEKSVPSYAKALDAVRKELFWQIGSYELIVTAQFGKCKKDFVYEFYVSEDIWNDLNYNVSELLDTYLKTAYRVPPAFKNVQVELKEKGVVAGLEL